MSENIALKIKYLFVISFLFIIFCLINNNTNKKKIRKNYGKENVKLETKIKNTSGYIINEKYDSKVTKNTTEFELNKNKIIYDKLELTSSLIKIYSDLYDYSRNGYTKPKFSKITKDYSLEQKNLNTL